MAGKMRGEASSSSNSRKESVVEDFGKRRSSCGYCRSPGRTSISHGLWPHSITVDDYQDLLDRGWRRSGCFLYKPEMERTCCPSYTIRLRASDFVPSKEQLRVSRRMQRFLDGTLDIKKVGLLEEPNTSKGSKSLGHHDFLSQPSKVSLSSENEEQNEVEKELHYLSFQIDKLVHMFSGNGDFPPGIQLPEASVKIVSQGKRKLLVKGSEDLLYTSNIAFQIASVIRRKQSSDENVLQLRLSKHCAEENGLSPSSIAEKLAGSLNQVIEISGLSIRACNGHINFYCTNRQASSGESVQNAVSKSSTGCGSGRNYSKSPQLAQEKRQRLQIRLKRSSFDPEEYELYRRYQIKVHNDAPDHVSESSYRMFLVDSPLVFVSSTGDGTVPPCGFGSFHQQYVIDGKLIAVGVVDILPRCLSSKYLFWDPDFAFLSLGKYSALQEIRWVKENQDHCPSLQYYYLGYYIHSCSKMRYKAAYRPSELLCPLRYQWVSFDIARPLLDKKPYVILSDFTKLQNGKLCISPVTENDMEMQHDGIGQEDSNDIPINEDEEMIELESESSDEESGSETSGLTSREIVDGDVSKILIGLKDSRLKFKDLQSSVGPTKRRYLEAQLNKYMRVVGSELSERMVYSLD
ncbi:Arginyl-tRNA--protein transferase [Quillaja saponaria]|uniref:Arginyl-tRNA--protein transferase n=1 Tax=Quillaja saponaria TaxID=32244 RepID=A0AAD7LK54_QUISA|nr:Arginyl-tRNA--protein transferase [Quillaja saponaria]